MKFKIRYADQIVGGLSILAILALVLVIFMLGNKQRWFAKDYNFRTTFDSATGINVGMQLQYKGFTIGKIKSLQLDKHDLVDVVFCVYDTYYDRVKEGSLIALIVSPIGLGNQFLFYPGNGETLIPEGATIPRADSPEGLALIEEGLVTIPKRDDTISNIIAQVNPILTNLNDTLSELNGAFKGSGKGPLAETMRGAASTMTNVSGITGEVYGSMDKILADLADVTTSVKGITSNLEELSAAVKDPKGLVPELIDPDGKIFGSIENSLKSVEGTLDNVEDSSSILKSQVPQLGRMIEDLRLTLTKAQDVLEGLRNNPLLKNGIPERVQADSSGTSSRNIDF